MGEPEKRKEEESGRTGFAVVEYVALGAIALAVLYFLAIIFIPLFE